MLTVGWLPGMTVCRWHITGTDQKVLWGSVLVTQPGEGPPEALGLCAVAFGCLHCFNLQICVQLAVVTKSRKGEREGWIALFA